MENLENCSDPDLLRRAMAGDERAFVALYERLKNGIFRYAFYMTSSRQAAEEVAQEVFIALLKEGGSYREGQGDVGAFAFGIARNYVRRIERRERPYQSLPEEGASEEVLRSVISQAESLTGQLIQGERTRQVQAAIASLPDHYRQAVVLCDLCELSYEEAASRLRCAVGTIRSRLNRAHALLAQKLKPLQDRPPGVQAGTEGCLI
ncbi:MAG TPA: RNA polymerase sigma factor [Candidatus Acidoferrales bacterium]|nr:RNA polymerase sigma factor [Candidatus Acidoferrales bacterium]